MGWLWKMSMSAVGLSELPSEETRSQMVWQGDLWRPALLFHRNMATCGLLPGMVGFVRQHPVLSALRAFAFLPTEFLSSITLGRELRLPQHDNFIE